jgi:hypothetical protein
MRSEGQNYLCLFDNPNCACIFGHLFCDYSLPSICCKPCPTWSVKLSLTFNALLNYEVLIFWCLINVDCCRLERPGGLIGYMTTSGRTSRASLSSAEHAVYVVLDLKLLEVLDLWILNFWRNTNLPRSRTHLSVFSYLTACSPCIIRFLRNLALQTY